MNYFDQLTSGKSAAELDRLDGRSPSTDQVSFGWLPLPSSIARFFPWILEASLTAPLPISKLGDPDLVASLDKRMRRAYEDALRRKFREILAHETLPSEFLSSPVRPEAVSEVRAHLSRHGTPSRAQPESLCISDALSFIGRRPNRLVQCASRDAEWLEGPEGPDPLETIKVDERILGSRNQIAFKRALRHDNNPYSLRHALEVPRRWRKLRVVADSSVAVLLSDGACLSANDPRFGWLLLRIHGHVPLRGQPVDQVEKQIREIGNPTLQETSDLLVDRLALAQAATTATEIRELLDALIPRYDNKESASLVLSGRYGLDGKDMTLEECGEAHKLTRERVRQLQFAFEKSLRDCRAYVPALFRFAKIIETSELRAFKEIGTSLSDLLGVQSPLGAVVAARAVLARPEQGWIFHGMAYPPYGLTISCWSTRLAQPDLLAILRSARSMVSKVGAFHVTLLCGDVSEELKTYISKAEVYATLDGCDQFCWIDREAGWGTIRGIGDAPVFREVRKMLAVAYPTSLDITDICAGLAACRRQIINRESSSRFGGGMPPPWVVRKLLELQPDLQIAQYDNFKLKEGLDPMLLIESEAEKVILQTLLRGGGIASWRELRQNLVDGGSMNPITFSVVLKSSSIFYQPGYGIYALRGIRFNIETVWGKLGEKSFARPSNVGAYSFQNQLSDVLECDVNQTSTETGRHRVVYVPTAVVQNAAGTYLHQDSPGLRIRISNRGQVARLANELAESGVRPKETVRLVLDTVRRTYSWKRKSP